MATTYDTSDIQVLDYPENIQRRPGMYVGGTGRDALHHLAHELIDNAVDEALAGACSHVGVNINSDGSLTVKVEKKPAEVNLWQATNPEARDFRVDTIGKAYTKSSLAATADGTYVATVTPPAKGFTAFFVEVVYPSGHEYPFKFTTDVSVVPDILAFEMPSTLSDEERRRQTGE